jgi:hypothetical protein
MFVALPPPSPQQVIETCLKQDARQLMGIHAPPKCHHHRPHPEAGTTGPLHGAGYSSAYGVGNLINTTPAAVTTPTALGSIPETAT